MADKDTRLTRYRALAKIRALHEEIVMNLDKFHGAVLTGLGNEAAPVGVLLGLMESMSAKDYLLSPKCGDQRSQMAIASVNDLIVESDHDHSYQIIYNHLQRKSVEDGNVHWGCLEHGIWPFFTSDMLRPISLIAGASWEVRRYLQEPVGVYMFGEGAASQGVAHEVMTWLSAQNCKRTDKELSRYKGRMPLSAKAEKTGVLRPSGIILALQVNNWSIYTDTIDEHGGRSKRDKRGKSQFSRWAESYGPPGGNLIRGVDVNGDDLEEVINATSKAVAFAKGDSPQSTLLVLHMEMRRTGHNEHQISRNPKDRENRDWSKGEILGVDTKEFEKIWENEPLKKYGEYLIDLGVASQDELTVIFDEERDLMSKHFVRASKEPPATFNDSFERRKDKYFMFKPHEWKLPHKERPKEKMLQGGTTTDRALLEVIGEFLEEDEGVVYQGEDVGSGGVLIASRRLQEKFGPERIFDSPISEEAILGTTAGASIMRWILREHGVVDTSGTKICEMQFMPFDGDGQVILRSLAPNWYQKKMPHGFINIEHYGVVHGGGSGHYHSDCRELDYINMPGLAVVCSSDAYDLVGLMRAARECEWPVVFMSSIWSYGEQECAAIVPKEKYLIQIGKAGVKREGKDITVITYGTCVRAALREAEFLVEEGIDLEIVDLRSLAPLDMETIASSVKKTGRLVVMTEASPMMGEWLTGKIVSNPEFLLEVYNKASYIPVLSRSEAPIAAAKDIEWHDLPFEEYVEESHNTRSETITRKHLRSGKLAMIARDLMRY